MTDDGEDSTSQSMSPDSMDEERPLKKARYVWQIKSPYRLGQPRGRGSSRSRQPPLAQVDSAIDQRPIPEEELPIIRWQTRQIARAVIDNTINQVIGDMGFGALEETDDEPIRLDITYPGPHNSAGIENEAVLMAIQSHGLQKPCECAHSSSTPSAATHNIPFHHRPSTPIPVVECTPSTSHEKYAFIAQAVAGENDFIAQAITSENDFIGQAVAGENDFIAQAVAVAIQKKGLGSYSPTETD